MLDLSQFAAQTGNDLALQREILTLFVNQSSEILALLQHGSGAPQVRADLAHRLKGSAQTIGAFILAEAADAVETQLRAGHATSLALGDLGGAVDAAHAEIDLYLARLSHPG